MCLITGKEPARLSLACGDDVYEGHYKKGHRENDGKIEQGLFHASAGGVNAAVTASKKASQPRALGLYKNQDDQGHRDDDLYQVQKWTQL